MAKSKTLRHQTAVATYRYTNKTYGATGVHGLGVYIPANAIVQRVMGYGPTGLTGGGNMSVSLGTAMMITGHPAGGATYGASSAAPRLLRIFGATTGTGQYFLRSTASEVKVNFTSNVTAGAFNIIVDYLVL